MKSNKKLVQIIHENGTILYSGNLNELPLREDYIIAKSIELFHEKDPCIIYRTHVAKKFYLNLYELLNQQSYSLSCYTISELQQAVDLDLADSSITYIHQ